ncbi:hypothetical protein BHM03_00050275 [Ensete ventricosum]|nr:hypothetical protein BHM03_00050275 [Ensete ventricosum]
MRGLRPQILARVEEEEAGAAGYGKQRGYDKGGYSRCGCGRGKKMRRARLEATTTAWEDGCSLRSHDGEEEWATVMRLRAGRQQRQGKRRRPRSAVIGDRSSQRQAARATRSRGWAATVGRSCSCGRGSDEGWQQRWRRLAWGRQQRGRRLAAAIGRREET